MNKIPLNLGLILILLIFIPISVFAQIEEDFDNDGDADGIDFAIMNMEYGRQDCNAITPCVEDIHPFKYPDGDVDKDDLAKLAAVFGRINDGGIDCLVLGDSIGAGTHANDVCDRSLGDHRKLMDCLDLRLGSHDSARSYMGGSKVWSITTRLCNGKVHNYFIYLRTSI